MSYLKTVDKHTRKPIQLFAMKKKWIPPPLSVEVLKFSVKKGEMIKIRIIFIILKDIFLLEIYFFSWSVWNENSFCTPQSTMKFLWVITFVIINFKWGLNLDFLLFTFLWYPKDLYLWAQQKLIFLKKWKRKDI